MFKEGQPQSKPETDGEIKIGCEQDNNLALQKLTEGRLYEVRQPKTSTNFNGIFYSYGDIDGFPILYFEGGIHVDSSLGEIRLSPVKS